MSKRGLPNNVKMRHNSHYVEELFKNQPDSYEYRLLPIDKIIVNKDQPRNEIGDLTGLITSVKEKGILEPILVRRAGEQFSIISGERRFRAATELKLERIPTIILEADDLNTLEIALIENIQRKDLTPFEEADAYNVLLEKFQATHEYISNKIGKSRNNITETVTLARIPMHIREICIENNITSKSTLIEIAREETEDDMISLIDEIVSKGLSRSDIREKRRKKKEQGDSEQKLKPFVFKYKPKNSNFLLNLKFKTENEPSKEEIIDTLISIIEDLRK